MKVKRLFGGITIAGALGAAALGVGAGAAGAAPGPPPVRRGATARRTRRVIPAGLADLAALADLGRAVPVHRRRVGQAGRVTMGPAARVGQAGRVTTGPAARVGRVTAAPVGRANTGPVAPVGQATAGQAVQAAPTPGTAIRIAGTSTTRRGETGPHRGAMASRHGRHGTGRSLRQAGHGITAQSTTTATRKLPCGIPDTTSGASTSSGLGFRCKA